MGQILYNGPYSPRFHESMLPPYENFTVQIPSSASAGAALIGVVHVTLIGVRCPISQCFTFNLDIELTVVCVAGWLLPLYGSF